jgi:hypothetical protein
LCRHDLKLAIHAFKASTAGTIRLPNVSVILSPPRAVAAVAADRCFLAWVNFCGWFFVPLATFLTEPEYNAQLQ